MGGEAVMESLFGSVVGETLSLDSSLMIILSSLLFGLGISLAYMFAHQKEGYNANFIIALIMLPAIIAMIILLVGNNVARAFSLAGAFSLIRFRSAPGNSRDIAYVFFTLGVGLACGMGYIGYAALFAFILCTVMILLTRLRFGANGSYSQTLKIVVPENLNFDGVFDQVLKEYTNSYKLKKVKTTDFGSLFELTYELTLKNLADSKKLIDNLRCLNGNLNIVLTVKDQTEEAAF